MKTLCIALSGISLMVASMGCCCGLGGGQCCGYGGGGCPTGGCGVGGPTVYPQGAFLNDGSIQAAAVQVQPASQVASATPIYNPVYRTTLLDPLPTF